MNDASKTTKQKAKPQPVMPDMPSFEATDDDAARTAKWAKFHDELAAWQAAQPVIETWEELEEIDDSNSGPLYIPEWKRNVQIRGLTRDEYNELDETCRQGGVLDTEKMGRAAMALCLEKPRIAPDAPIGKKSTMAIKRIMDGILERSGVLGEVAAEYAATFQD